ncbi:MAG: TerB family tellurite resistance protein [Gammaproteobacteria bacterium]
MLDAIKAFYEEHIAPASRDTQAEEEHRLRVAVAALLAEVVRMDEEIAGGERAQVLASIGEKFDLDPGEARELVALAEEEARAATDFYQFTSQINRAFSPARKRKLIEHMWRVAYADGTLHKYEDHLVRKVADLIHVPHETFIVTKLRVQGGS